MKMEIKSVLLCSLSSRIAPLLFPETLRIVFKKVALSLLCDNLLLAFPRCAVIALLIVLNVIAFGLVVSKSVTWSFGFWFTCFGCFILLKTKTTRV